MLLQSEKARKRESKKARKQESEKARKQESEKARKRESEKARKRESEKARKRESDEASDIVKFIKSFIFILAIVQKLLHCIFNSFLVGSCSNCSRANSCSNSCSLLSFVLKSKRESEKRKRESEKARKRESEKARKRESEKVRKIRKRVSNTKI